MTPERLAEIRDALTSGNEGLGMVRAEGMALELLAALDAEKARSAKAGRDLALAGEQARERERALNAELTEAVMAAEARAQTAEDALATELSARNLSGEVLQRCDVVLNGQTPGTHWRSLHGVDVQVAALKARAKTAEDALARLRDAVGAVFDTQRQYQDVNASIFDVRRAEERLREALEATKLRGER